MNDTKPCRKCGEDKPISSYFERAGHRAITCGDCRKNAKGKAAEQRAEARREQEIALKDEIWSAMWRGRSQRALTAVQPKQLGLHRIRLRYERGYISIAELACRCAERDACHRASRACQTAQAVGAAARILEQPTETLERIRQVHGLWRTEQPPRTPAILRDTEGADEDTEGDPFADAFGDWAPACVQHAHAP